ncbi:hypothetical protein, partial [Helicobacter sp. 12S02634-8]|uniref:hypothetical protein n=1 Tax=Helicobacter sp. 12S02634-8 TaxID=1476199 RepID=UPI001C0F301E
NSFKGILKGFNTMGATLILQKVFKDFSRCFKRLFKGVIDCTHPCIFLTKLNQRVFSFKRLLFFKSQKRKPYLGVMKTGVR